MNIASLSIEEFLTRLGSSDPTPGGGCLVAVTGSMAAAQIAMVCNLTIGRRQYAGVEVQVQGILADVLVQQRELLELATADTEVYGAVRDAFRLPRDTDDEKATRKAAIESAMHPATEVPVRTAEASRGVLELCLPAAETTNTSTLSDVAVATHLALAATRAGADQAQLNVASLTDPTFAVAMQQRIEQALAGAEAMAERALVTVRSRAQG
jgi:methenyltetrahydrofolate cyclohydrolase